MSTRREFLDEVGQGMLAVLIGPALAAEMGLANQAEADDKPAKTTQTLDKLAGLLQETAPAKLFPVLKGLMDKGTDLKTLVAAGALANARAFAGQDYEGYHTFMALPPAYAMSTELPEKEKALPIFKVLYRNSSLVSDRKCHFKGKLPEAKAADVKEPKKALLQAVRKSNADEADRIAVAMDKGKPEDLFEDIQDLIQDSVHIHKVVLAWRSWEALDFTGKEHARTLLRASVRHCTVYNEERTGKQTKGIRDTLPKVMEANKLMKKAVGKRTADDKFIEKLATTIYGSSQDQASEAVAAALAEGFSPASIGEALSLASTQLVLTDAGRKKQWAIPAKPEGSVHGDSVGVHASDAANAWRNIAGVTSARNTYASLIAAAYHTAGQLFNSMKTPWPLPADVEKVKGKTAASLVKELDEAIRGKDQRMACAIVQRYGQLNFDAKNVFAVCRKYAVSEEGALHAEKYYRTVSQEFSRTRKSLRFRHLVALARVTASLYGYDAKGMARRRRS